jgi:diaminopimelate decarboxylase
MPPTEWQSLAETYGTPFYLYDTNCVTRRIEEVRSLLRGRVRIYYAVKANPNLGLLQALVSAADGLDISSAGELSQARLAGYDPKRMSFAGPAKTLHELESAISAGVGCISIESMRELEGCAGIAERLRRKASVLLRVNPSAVHRSYGLKMGGRAVQFGIDEEDLPEAAARIRAHASQIEFLGIHCYLGSQCFDAAGVAESVATALRIATDLGHRFGLQCRTINFGGGFGVSHGEDGRALDVVELARLLLPLISAHDSPDRPPAELIFELGRYLVAPAGIYVTRVVGKKISRGKMFLMCDGGLHHHLAAAGTFGAALRGNFALRNLTRPDGMPSVCNIAGPSCNPTDLLGVDARVAELEEGDLLGVLMSGSYGLTASPILFLGRPTAVELVRTGNKIGIGRRRFQVGEFN